MAVQVVVSHAFHLHNATRTQAPQGPPSAQQARACVARRQYSLRAAALSNCTTPGTAAKAKGLHTARGDPSCVQSCAAQAGTRGRAASEHTVELDPSAKTCVPGWGAPQSTRLPAPCVHFDQTGQPSTHSPTRPPHQPSPQTWPCPRPCGGRCRQSLAGTGSPGAGIRLRWVGGRASACMHA